MARSSWFLRPDSAYTSALRGPSLFEVAWRTSGGLGPVPRAPVGPPIRNLNGLQFRALLTEGGAERLELVRAWRAL